MSLLTLSKIRLGATGAVSAPSPSKVRSELGWQPPRIFINTTPKMLYQRHCLLPSLKYITQLSGPLDASLLGPASQNGCGAQLQQAVQDEKQQLHPNCSIPNLSSTSSIQIQARAGEQIYLSLHSADHEHFTIFRCRPRIQHTIAWISCFWCFGPYSDGPRTPV